MHQARTDSAFGVSYWKKGNETVKGESRIYEDERTGLHDRPGINARDAVSDSAAS